jgi:hypothetical protein
MSLTQSLASQKAQGLTGKRCLTLNKMAAGKQNASQTNLPQKFLTGTELIWKNVEHQLRNAEGAESCGKNS